jgi:copper(I)-binding protein
MIRTVFTIAALLAAFALPAQAADVMAGKLKISAPWARATPKGAPVGGGYLTITNMGSAPDRLIGGTASFAKSEIKPGQTVTLDPSGYHLMFMGLTQPLKQGEHVKVTLDFAEAGKVDIDFAVEGMGAMHGGAGGGMPGMKMN